MYSITGTFVMFQKFFVMWMWNIILLYIYWYTPVGLIWRILKKFNVTVFLFVSDFYHEDGEAVEVQPLKVSKM